MTEFDKRRTPYVPMDVMLAFGDFGTKLINRWGMEGIAGWMLFLAACKREPVQGQFTYTSDAEGWSKLGATASAYTLDEFFTYTGRCKKTSRTRHGRITYVQVTRWKAWNTPPGNRQNPRKEKEITEELPENTNELREITPPEAEAEAEAEKEVEHEAEQEASALRDKESLEDLGLRLAARSAPPVGSYESVRVLLDDADANTDKVLRPLVEQLSVRKVQDLCDELTLANVRTSRCGLAVRIAQRMLGQEAA